VVLKRCVVGAVLEFCIFFFEFIKGFYVRSNLKKNFVCAESVRSVLFFRAELFMMNFSKVGARSY